MSETDEMEQLFECLPWLGEQLKLEQKIKRTAHYGRTQIGGLCQSLGDFEKQVEDFT